MSDEDDLELDDLEESFDDFDKKGKSLGDLWRDNPIVKIGSIAALVGVVFLVIMSFGGGSKAPDPSFVGSTGGDLTSVPGGSETSQAYIEAIEETNEAAVEEAFSTGTSALPVPIDPAVSVISAAPKEEEPDDPLARWRMLQEERLEREIQQREVIAPVQQNTAEADTSRQEAIQELASAMSEQMGSILERATTSTDIRSLSVTDVGFLEQLEEQRLEEQAALEEAMALEEDSIEGESTTEVLLPAGQIAYAELMIEANTDSPGPVLAQILSGPLKGNRILGTFEEENELITLSFDTVVIGEDSVSIDAVAIDPDTTLPGMATEVDHRYFQRIVLPAAAAFVDGMATAIAESGRTTVTVEGDTVSEETEDADSEQEVATGIQEAGQEVRSILDDIVNDIEVLVRLEVGTPMGILFLEPVTVDNEG